MPKSGRNTGCNPLAAAFGVAGVSAARRFCGYPVRPSSERSVGVCVSDTFARELRLELLVAAFARLDQLPVGSDQGLAILPFRRLERRKRGV